MSRHEPRGTSLTEILEHVDPNALPYDARHALAEIGPYLASGMIYREIGDRIGRSEDYVGAKVRLVRDALLLDALERWDQMSPGLRTRLDAFVAMS